MESAPQMIWRCTSCVQNNAGRGHIGGKQLIGSPPESGDHGSATKIHSVDKLSLDRILRFASLVATHLDGPRDVGPHISWGGLKMGPGTPWVFIHNRLAVEGQMNLTRLERSTASCCEPWSKKETSEIELARSPLILSTFVRHCGQKGGRPTWRKKTNPIGVRAGGPFPVRGRRSGSEAEGPRKES
eukprot:4847365-Amphidinium_carterae.1